MEERTNGIIQEGTSVKEAVNRGLAELGIREQDAHIIVLNEGSRGILRLLGGRKARVKIVPAVNEEERIRRIVDELMSHMGLGGQVEVSISDNRISVAIETAGLDGLLIGRHGQTLDALQHLVDRMLNHGSRERRRVTVDVGGYRKRRGSSRRAKSSTGGRSGGAGNGRHRGRSRGRALVRAGADSGSPSGMPG